MTTTPSPEQKRLWMTMARLVSHLARTANAAVEAEHDVSVSEMTLMGQLRAASGSARMVDLAQRLGVTKAAITKLVDSLEASGLVQRESDESDRRVIRATLTKRGRRVLGGAEETFESIMQRDLWSHLSPADTAAVEAALGGVQHELGIAPEAVMPPQAGE